MRNILILTTLLAYSSIIGQEKLSDFETFKIYENIKKGYLLVRIEDYGKAIESLKERGKYIDATELEEKATMNKLAVLSNFSNYYYYSDKVLFYYSSKAKEVLVDHDYSHIFDIENAPIEIDSLLPFFLCMKQGPDFTVSSNTKYYHIYQLANGQIRQIPKPFRTLYRPDLITRLFAPNKYANDVDYLNQALQEEYEEYRF